MNGWKNSLVFWNVQLKNNQKMMLAYGILYIIAAITIIVLSIGAEEVSAWYKYMNCVGMAHIWGCVLSFVPALYCASEIINRKRHSYIRLSRFRWGRKDLLLCNLISMCLPLGLSLIINVRFYQDRTLEEDIAWCYWRLPAANLVVIFVLTALAVLLGIITKNRMLPFMAVLAYIFVMLFTMSVPISVNVIVLGEYMGDDWWLQMLKWGIIGVGLSEASIRWLRFFG